MPTSLSTQEIRCRLRYRGFLRADGSLNRGALRTAIVEQGWIYVSDLRNNILEQTQRVGSLPKVVRKGCAEQYVKNYISLLSQRYSGVSLQSDEWALESLFPVLEDFLSRAERQPKQERDALQAKFTGIVLELSERSAASVEETLLVLACGANDFDAFCETCDAKSMLDVLYSAATIFEFAQDVSPPEFEPESIA